MFSRKNCECVDGMIIDGTYENCEFLSEKFASNELFERVHIVQVLRLSNFLATKDKNYDFDF